MFFPPYFGQQPPLFPAGMQGKTMYRYYTPDGNVPMEGKVPSGSALDPSAQTGNCVPGSIHPYPFPNQAAAPPPFGYAGWPAPPAPQPPPYYWQPGQPPSSCYPAPPPFNPYAPPKPPPPAPYACGPHPPPPPPSHAFESTNKEPEPPLNGNRVNGQIATFPDRKMGHIFSKHNVTFHLFNDNVINKYLPNWETLPDHLKAFKIHGEDYHTVHTVACSMTAREFIEQIRCSNKPNCHVKYESDKVGFQELVTRPDGWFVPGRKIVLTSYDVDHNLGAFWSSSHGSAGQKEPVWIVRLPE